MVRKVKCPRDRAAILGVLDLSGRVDAIAADVTCATIDLDLAD